METAVQLAKYHGLGNDFLVLLALPSVPGARIGSDLSRSAAFARAACDRHRGIGADGLLVVLPAPSDGSADLTMRLHNADGSLAEMSGNGIRCFVHGAIDAGVVSAGTLRVATGAGVRIVEALASDSPRGLRVRVDMGRVVLDAFDIPPKALAIIGGSRARAVDVGNPHVVVERDPSSVDIAVFGPAVEEHFLSRFGGMNVEVVGVGDAAGVLDMKVWERGVGVTEACGTGATATAVAAHDWGLVRALSTVRQPGGDATVEIGEGTVALIGPSQFIASCQMHWPER